MNEYPFDRSITNERELLDYFANAIRYRNDHKDREVEIALHVFHRTRPRGMLSFPIDEELERLHYEFGALEAPGWSEDESKSLEESHDEAWQYLLELVNKTKENRTV